MLGTFETRNFPSSINTRSVNVPPTSTPTRIRYTPNFTRSPLTAFRVDWQCGELNFTPETNYRGDRECKQLISKAAKPEPLYRTLHHVEEFDMTLFSLDPQALAAAKTQEELSAMRTGKYPGAR